MAASQFADGRATCNATATLHHVANRASTATATSTHSTPFGGACDVAALRLLLCCAAAPSCDDFADGSWSQWEPQSKLLVGDPLGGEGAHFCNVLVGDSSTGSSTGGMVWQDTRVLAAQRTGERIGLRFMGAPVVQLGVGPGGACEFPSAVAAGMRARGRPLVQEHRATVASRVGFETVVGERAAVEGEGRHVGSRELQHAEDYRVFSVLNVAAQLNEEWTCKKPSH